MLIEYSLETFLNHPNIDKVILVVSRDNFDFCSKMFKSCKSNKRWFNRRQKSSHLALQACPESTINVLIHDAAQDFLLKKVYH